jgi:predicted deacylase
MARPGTASDFEIAGTTVAPGATVRLELPVARLATQTMLSMPLAVVHGARPGPVLWLSAAIHGDELCGVEAIRRVLEQLDAGRMAGTVLAVPIVNVFGFLNQSRYLPDRRDLNRSFPGSTRGSLASRMADLFLREIVSRADYGIDLHTATNGRVNWPQLRADLGDADTARIARAFGAPVMVHSRTRDGSLREAAIRRGIPVLLFEGGEALRFDEPAVRSATEGILRVAGALGMWRAAARRAGEPLVVRRTHWVRAARSGLARLHVALGARVRRRQSLGVVADAFGDLAVQVLAPCDGVVLSLSRNPSVHRGDGLVHIGEISTSAEAPPAGVAG